MRKLLTVTAAIVLLAYTWPGGPTVSAQESPRWTELGPTTYGGPVLDIDIDPANTSNMLVASDGGGIWRSTNAGSSWTRVGSGSRIRDLQRHPTQAGVVFAGTESGLLRSTDNGATWAARPMPASIDGGVKRLAISPDGATMLMAASRVTSSLTQPELGNHIYRSTDEGATWTHTLWNSGGGAPTDVALTANARAMTVQNLTDSQGRRTSVWSSNGGATWSGNGYLCSGSSFTRVAFAPSAPTTAYQLCGAVLRSTDSGQTLEARALSVGGSSLWIDPTDANTIVVGSTAAWLSRDGGATATQITDATTHRFGPGAHVHTVVSDPGFNGTSNRRVFIGTDYGVFRVDDIYAATPSSWVALNTGLAIAVIESLSIGADNAVLAATINQDVLRLASGSSTFTRAGTNTAPASRLADLRRRGLLADRTDGAVVMLLQQPSSSELWRSGDSASTFTTQALPLVGTGLEYGLLDPSDGNRRYLVYGADSGALSATSTARDASPAWTFISNPIRRMYDWTVAPGDGNVLWGVGYDVFSGTPLRLARSTNGRATTPTFTVTGLTAAGVVDNVSGAVPTPHRLAIATTGSVAYLVTRAGGASATTPQPVQFFRTTDGGTTWTRMSDVPAAVNEIIAHPTVPSWVFAATTSGIYFSQNGGATWTADAQTGSIEAINVTDIAWRGTTLIAATAGRGLWARADIPPTVAVNRSLLRFGARRSTAPGALTSVTPAQEVVVSFVGGTGTWTATADQPWVIVTNGTGSGAGAFQVSIDPAHVFPAGSPQSTVVRITSPQVSGDTQVGVSLDIDLSTNVPSSGPFGAFDSPAEGATNISGTVAVTGWALDDVAVNRVEIWRNCVGIDFTRGVCSSPTGQGMSHVRVGQATFLPGARPDVEAAMAFEAAAYRAGWGYLLLTNAFPHLGTGTAEGGQGQFVLSAYAYDNEGLVSLLGTKSITLNNDAATRPFGAIDTPDQGATIPGPAAPYNNAAAYPVFGWGMTQAGKCIDTTSTSSYRVYVDGVARTLTPGVNWFSGLNRSDLAAAYPGLCNSTNALAAYYLDVRTLSNGLHTIGWDVYDNGNNVAGIGSRFFNVLVTGDHARPDARALDLPTAVGRQVQARVGSDDAPWQTVSRDASGMLAVRVPSGGRVVLDLGGVVRDGAQELNRDLRSLPAGSTLAREEGRFYWMPPVGFLGTFHLAFGGADGRIDVAVTVFDPTTVGKDVTVTLSSPRAGANPNPIVTVAGTATDPAAITGSGVSAVHVWARRVDVPQDPAFLGAAEITGTQFRLQTTPLAPGTYELMVFAWSTSLGDWAPAKTVVIAVR